jgi:hypothetical protein
MLAFILKACGLKDDSVTFQDLEDRDLDDLMDHIHEDAKEQNDYPLLIRVKGVRSFLSNFQAFWTHLASTEVLYDGVLLDFLMSWLSSLAVSKMRPLRHTATTALLAIGRSLVDLEAGELHDLQTVESFLEHERRKSQSSRVPHLESQQNELGGRIKTLEAALDQIYSEVLLRRSKDVMLEVRTVCVQALGMWAEKSPLKFMTETTLKTLAMMLFDKAAIVRQYTIDSFLRLFANEANVAQMKPLTQRYKLRILEMCHDVESKICVHALKLCGQLAKHCVLEIEDIDMLTTLCWAEVEEIRVAAFDFVLTAVLNERLPVSSDNGLKPGLDQGRRLSVEQALRSLLQFYLRYADGQIYRIDLLVECLWHKTDVVKDVSTMIEVMLSSSKSNSSEGEHAAVLGYMLLASLKTHRRKHTGSDASAGVLSSLPELLTTYRLEPSVLKCLLKLTQSLDLGCLYSQDLSHSFSGLLETLGEMIESQTDIPIIKRTGVALLRLMQDSHSGQKEAKDLVVSLMDDTLKDLKRVLGDYFRDEQHSQELALAVSLARFASLLGGKDFLDVLSEGSLDWHQSEILRDLRGLVQLHINDCLAESAVAQQALRAIYLVHLWDLTRLTAQVDLEGYLNRRQATLELMLLCTDKPTGCQVTKRLAFKLLCETLVLVSSQSLAHSPLYCELDDEVCATLEDYMLSVPLVAQVPLYFNPSKVFVKQGARGDVVKEDADDYSQRVCLMIGRLVSYCPALTMSQLASSYLAYYGSSSLHTVSLLTKQILNCFMSNNAKALGAFKEPKLFFGIMADALIKCYRGGADSDLALARELGRKISGTLATADMKPLVADRLRGFLQDCLRFAMEQPDHLGFFDVIGVFIQRNLLSPVENKALYEQVLGEVNRLEGLVSESGSTDNLLGPPKSFLAQLGKLVGLRVEMPPPEAETTPLKRVRPMSRSGSSNHKGKNSARSKDSKRSKESSKDLAEEISPVKSQDQLLPDVNGEETEEEEAAEGSFKEEAKVMKSASSQARSQPISERSADKSSVRPSSVRPAEGRENRGPNSRRRQNKAAAALRSKATRNRAADNPQTSHVIREEAKKNQKPLPQRNEVAAIRNKSKRPVSKDKVKAEVPSVQRGNSINSRKRRTREEFKDGDLEEPIGRAREAVKRRRK